MRAPETVVLFTEAKTFGGAERVMLQLIGGLDRRRWRPVLFTHDEPGVAPLVAEAERLDAPHRVMPRMVTAKDLWLLPRFARALAAERTALLHAHLTWPLACKYGLLAAAVSRIPAIATAHSQFAIPAPLVKQPKLIARLVRRYIACSPGVGRQLAEEFGIPRTKIEVVPNGVTMSTTPAATDADRSRLRQELAGSTAGPIVLTVARLVEEKGHRYLIRAAVDVPDAVFLLAGEGSERPALETLARDLGVHHRVRFLGRRSDMPLVFGIADLFVLPSSSEGLPLALLEAMALGVPVVATNIDGNADLVVPERTGILVSPEDPAALSSAIRRMLGRPGEARAMAEEGVKRARDEFSTDRMVQRTAEVYEEVLAR